MTDSFRPKSFRDKAWEALRGKWGMSAVMALVYMMVAETGVLVSCILPIVGPITAYILFVIPMVMGMMFLFLDVSNGKDVEVTTLFETFKDYGRYVGGSALVFVYVLLWCMLLYIPGIIKMLSYSQTFYLMRENPELKGEEAIQLSMKMMKGHKWELFLLGLSFIGWGLLCIPTLGIGYFWLIPYMQTAHAEFYKELKKDWEVRQGFNAAETAVA